MEEARVRGIPVRRIGGGRERISAVCGLPTEFDKRVAGQVQRHNEHGHAPFTDAELREFATAREQAR